MELAAFIAEKYRSEKYYSKAAWAGTEYLKYLKHLKKKDWFESTPQEYEYLMRYLHGQAAFDYLRAKDYAKALETSKPYLKKKDHMALYCTGQMLFYGLGVKKNPKLGFKLLKRSAHSGWPNALASVGRIYAKGTGIKKDLPKAFAYTQVALNMANVLIKFKTTTREKLENNSFSFDRNLAIAKKLGESLSETQLSRAREFKETLASKVLQNLLHMYPKAPTPKEQRTNNFITRKLCFSGQKLLSALLQMYELDMDQKLSITGQTELEIMVKDKYLDRSKLDPKDPHPFTTYRSDIYGNVWCTLHGPKEDKCAGNSPECEKALSLR